MRQSARELRNEIITPAKAQHVRHVSDFTHDAVIRSAINEGYASYRPNIPTEAVRFSPDPIDVFVSSASKMDSHGYFSLGPFGGWGMDFADRAKHIVVESNPNQPRILGDCFVHVSKVDAVIDASYEIRDLPHWSSGVNADVSVDERVADWVVSLIPNRCTLQIGAGRLPDLVVRRLIGSKTFSAAIHSEAVSDWIVDLSEAGMIDNSVKDGPDRGKSVFAMAIGTHRLYNFLNDNPGVAQRRMSYTNDTNVISRNHRQISLNSTLCVDLTGQCASETLNGHHYSGTGGQWEFNRGGYLSEGGKGIIALPATARSGTVSRIVDRLPLGSAVSIGRNDVDYVVTEHGVAHLKGHDLSSRARQLIAIADPAHREALETQARALSLI
jgi:4-hydroxybutyrate CoA-transferase